MGKLETSAAHLAGAIANKEKFIAYAAGYIKGITKADIIAIDQDGIVTIIQDALEWFFIGKG